MNASVANSDLPITYETSTIANGVIRIDNVTGALNVNGTLDADIDVNSLCSFYSSNFILVIFHWLYTNGSN